MEKKPELLVIDPSILRPEMESFRLISRQSSIPASFHLPALEGMETLWEAEKSVHCVGAIILGSAASVRDEREWQGELIRWLRKKISPHFPILGICFGHQLLAYMHGAPVVECAQKNLGFREVKVRADKRWGLDEGSLPMFVAHNDCVSEIPEGFELFASSDLISIDGLRHKTLPIWSLQAHIDATETFAINSFYTQKKNFHQLKKGNEVLTKFLQYLLSPSCPRSDPKGRECPGI